MARKTGQTTARRRTARDIPRLREGLHRFDPTLYLRVQGNSRAWVQRIVVHGRQVDRGLGGWPLVTLEDARLTALGNRRAVRAGQDPFAERTRETAPTFAAAANACLAAGRDGLAASTVKAWESTMRNHLLPRLGKRPINTVTRSDVIDTLKAIKSVSAAKGARQRIAKVFEFALSREWMAENPARSGNGIDAALPYLKGRSKAHHEAMPHVDVAAFLARLVDTVPVRYLRFQILTATRPTEAREAEWSEMDFEARTWTIPGSRMKGGRDHRIPLSDAALVVLEQQRGMHPRFVFPGRGAKPISRGASERLMKGETGTAHGFRSAFRTWAGETNAAEREVAESALAHVVGDQVEQAYARGDLFERRRVLMDKWAAYVTD